jgi:hypothetical protein
MLYSNPGYDTEEYLDSSFSWFHSIPPGNVGEITSITSGPLSFKLSVIQTFDATLSRSVFLKL